MLGLGAGPAGMQLPRVALSLTSLHCACRTVHRVVSDFGTSCVMTERSSPLLRGGSEQAGCGQRLQRVAVEKSHSSTRSNFQTLFHAGSMLLLLPPCLSFRHITDRVRDCDR